MTIKELFERLEEKDLKAIFTIEPSGDYAIRLVQDGHTSYKVIFSHYFFEESTNVDEILRREIVNMINKFADF